MGLAKWRVEGVGILHFLQTCLCNCLAQWVESGEAVVTCPVLRLGFLVFKILFFK